MKGDSFIYLNKYFVDNLFDRKLTIHNLVSRWIHGDLRQGERPLSGAQKNDYAFDRTNTIIGPLRETNISPIPDFDINFNKSLKEICDSAATDILNEGKPVDIFWSGGVDSTLVVISFLNVCKDLSQINIVYDKGGINEYPLFYEKYVKDVTQEPIKTWVYENVNLDDNIVVTGHPAGQLVPSSNNSNYTTRLVQILKRLGFDDCDLKAIPWQEVFSADIGVFGNPMYDEYFIEHITPQVENTPLKIETIGDLNWWLSFSMKWQGENVRALLNNCIKKLNYQKMQNCKPFYATDDFQKWGMWNYDWNRKKVLPPYKIDLKEIIYEFTKDEDYYINKKKESSGLGDQETARSRGFIRTNKGLSQIRAIDNQYNIFTGDSLYESTATYREDMLKHYHNSNYVSSM